MCTAERYAISAQLMQRQALPHGFNRCAPTVTPHPPIVQLKSDDQSAPLHRCEWHSIDRWLARLQLTAQLFPSCFRICAAIHFIKIGLISISASSCPHAMLHRAAVPVCRRAAQRAFHTQRSTLARALYATVAAPIQQRCSGGEQPAHTATLQGVHCEVTAELIWTVWVVSPSCCSAVLPISASAAPAACAFSSLSASRCSAATVVSFGFVAPAAAAFSALDSSDSSQQSSSRSPPLELRCVGNKSEWQCA
jgi:hypothetical protein